MNGDGIVRVAAPLAATGRSAYRLIADTNLGCAEAYRHWGITVGPDWRIS